MIERLAVGCWPLAAIVSHVGLGLGRWLLAAIASHVGLGLGRWRWLLAAIASHIGCWLLAIENRMRNFRKFVVWNEAIALADQITQSMIISLNMRCSH